MANERFDGQKDQGTSGKGETVTAFQCSPNTDGMNMEKDGILFHIKNIGQRQLVASESLFSTNIYKRETFRKRQKESLIKLI